MMGRVPSGFDRFNLQCSPQRARSILQREKAHIFIVVIISGDGGFLGLGALARGEDPDLEYFRLQ
jgi:precorrin-6B methylase 1